MSGSPSSSFNPIALVTILVVAVAAGGLFLLRSEQSPNPDPTDESPKTTTRSDGRSSNPGRTNSGGPSRSGGLTEKEKTNLGGRPADIPEAEIKRTLNKITTAARDDLAALRKEEMTPYEDPQRRREFKASLEKMESDRERKAAELDWTRKSRAAKAQARAQLTPEHVARKARLSKLIQVQSLWQRSSFIAKTPDFTTPAKDFERRLLSFAEESEHMDDEKFHQSFDSLQREVADLSKRRGKASPFTTSKPDQQSNTLTP